MRRHRANLAALLLVAVTATATSGCTDAHQDFCDRFRSTFQLTQLRDAIDRDDTATISRSLQDLEDLADDAPKAIAIDLHVVVDAVVGTVRAVTNVTSPGGESMPVDLAKLNAALAKVSENSQRVAQWADRDCNLALNR